MTATTYLATFLNHEKDLTRFSPRPAYLERVRAVLSQAGSPQHYLKTIHIAGSKGKGSTAAFTANILRAAGYTVGLYTSPHLYDVHERIRILKPGQEMASARRNIFPDCITEKELSLLIKKILPQLEIGRKQGLTYFEVLTILAFCYFRQQEVDWVVLETGLGGRLDATNVCDAVVSAITSISLEHTAQLGKTLAKIASEKAAIIKSTKSYVVVAPQKSEALRVIKARCRAVGVRMILAGGNSPGPLSLVGRHQKINASVAVEIAKVLKISKTAVKRGLAKTFWPLRFEVVRRKPLFILDGAHNPASCECLSETLKEVFPGKKWILVFGCSADKNIQSMLRPLVKNSQDLILAHARHPRAMKWKDSVAVVSACRRAIQLAGPENIIVVTGSLFVAAEARKYISK